MNAPKRGYVIVKRVFSWGFKEFNDNKIANANGLDCPLSDIYIYIYIGGFVTRVKNDDCRKDIAHSL